MARYIDTDKIIPTFTKWVDDVKKEYPDAYACAYIFTMKKIIEMLEDAVVEDVQPVVHGRWDESELMYKCSNCGAGTASGMANYCFMCGAKMDEADHFADISKMI